MTKQFKYIPMKKNKETTFKEKLSRLEEISEMLEDDSIELEAAIALYEEGTKLAAECTDTLRTAELKISKLENNGAVTVIKNSVTEEQED